MDKAFMIDYPFISLEEATRYLQAETGLELAALILSDNGFDPAIVGNFIMRHLCSKGWKFGIRLQDIPERS